MKTLKSMNFGVFGWILLIYQFIAYVAQTTFAGWPLNFLSDMYGGAALISGLYTAGVVIVLIIQLIMSKFVSKIKSVRKLGCIAGVVAVICAFLMMVIPPSMLGLWLVSYFLLIVCGLTWSLNLVNLLVGQWFPTKKGTFMGIATLAFPICNGMQGLFAKLLFKNGAPDVFHAFLPFWIVILIGVLIGIFLIRDYPEQLGAYRDNDKSMTPEAAKQMMLRDIENKKNSLWSTGKTLSTRDFWLMSVPCGLMLMAAVGMMHQTSVVIGSFGAQMDKFGGFGGIMFMVMIFGIIGSFVIGLIDTAIGTKKAVVLSCVLMVISGVLGLTNQAGMVVVSIIVLAVFMGASSNFLVSAAAQYWRREDFMSVFSCLSPIANIFQAVGPMLVAMIFAAKGTTALFGIILIAGIISVIMSALFSGKHVKAVDDKLRTAAGKVLDDELVGRK